MQVLAIYPQEPELEVFERMPPLGMLWVGGELRKIGCQVEFIDQQIDDRDPAALAAAQRPALTLLGGTSHSRFASFHVARKVKQAVPETVVVYGGPHATFTAEDTLTHVPEIDVVVHGEGEETCRELASCLRDGGRWSEDLDRIPGISYRRERTIRRNPPRRRIENLDQLGAPDRTLVPIDRYEMKMDYLGVPGASIMTARGCPIGCTFCSASAMFGRCYRKRSIPAVVEEIEELMANHEVRGIKIFDSTFTLNRRHVERFCRELERRKLKIPWECEVRADTVDKVLLAEMQAAGCYYVDLGAESGSQRVLDTCIRKRITTKQVEQVLQWTTELGLLTKVFFTLGHPGETFEEAKKTNRFIRRNRRRIRLAAYQAGIKVYPGTYVEEFAREHRLLPPGFRWSAPYENVLNRKLFRPVDNIPLLLQPKLGLRELRHLRLRFIIGRLLSPRFLIEKSRSVFRKGSLGAYVRIIGRGVLKH